MCCCLRIMIHCKILHTWYLLLAHTSQLMISSLVQGLPAASKLLVLIPTRGFRCDSRSNLGHLHAVMNCLTSSQSITVTFADHLCHITKALLLSYRLVADAFAAWSCYPCWCPGFRRCRHGMLSSSSQLCCKQHSAANCFLPSGLSAMTPLSRSEHEISGSRVMLYHLLTLPLLAQHIVQCSRL